MLNKLMETLPSRSWPHPLPEAFVAGSGDEDAKSRAECPHCLREDREKKQYNHNNRNNEGNKHETHPSCVHFKRP